jgi:hypothetical protein
MKPTVIEFKKRFEDIVIHYLESRGLSYQIIQSVNPKKSRIQIRDLSPEDAFNLGAQVQVQLLDGEYLI